MDQTRALSIRPDTEAVDKPTLLSDNPITSYTQYRVQFRLYARCRVLSCLFVNTFIIRAHFCLITAFYIVQRGRNNLISDVRQWKVKWPIKNIKAITSKERSYIFLSVRCKTDSIVPDSSINIHDILSVDHLSSYTFCSLYTEEIIIICIVSHTPLYFQIVIIKFHSLRCVP